MEHKLIQGGEQYLPFARSRIKALRATGLKYGNQRYDMGDALVEVKIALDEEYITISGGSCTLAMDSGVVDVLAIAELAPVTFLPGVMHETLAGASYNASFTLPQGGGDWLLNPAEDSSGQLAGIVKGSKAGVFKGKLPADKAVAASFSPRPEIDRSTVPATWGHAQRDEALWIKKVTGILCPASIFTGKTRLYIQALYGRHLYARRGEDVLGDPVTIGMVYGSPPYLKIPSYVRAGDATDYSSVQVTTSTGLHLDTATGKHWLLTMTPSGVLVHPLVGDACAESMRRLLIVPAPKGVTPLSTEGTERLETYILSRCLPDQANVQLATCALGMSFYSMGYGWHWNWSGTAADIVENNHFDQFPGDPQPSRRAMRAMSSSHYRVTATKHENPDVDGKKVQPTWTATLTALEVNKKWYINRTYWVIAEPDIQNGILIKTTPRRSELFASDGPFYAFYRGDDLNLCRAKFSILQPSPPTHTESDDLFHGDVPGSLGDRAGYSRDTHGGSEYYKCEITCGSQTSGGLFWGHVESQRKSEFTKKITNPLFGPRWGTEQQYVTRQYEFGYPPHQLSELIDSAIVNTSYVPFGDHDVEESTVRDEWLSIATVVVPPNDSEAIYLQAGQTKTTTKTGVVAHWTYGFFGEATQVNTYNYASQSWNQPIYFTKYIWNAFGTQNGLYLGNTPIAETTITTEIDVKKLLCKAGVVQLDNFTGIGALHDPTADESTGLFTVLSGASTRNPVVIAHKKNQPIGIDSGGTAPVFVGYV